MNRDDPVAGTMERETSAMLRPNWPARSRSMVISRAVHITVVDFAEGFASVQAFQQTSLVNREVHDAPGIQHQGVDGISHGLARRGSAQKLPQPQRGGCVKRRRMFRILG